MSIQGWITAGVVAIAAASVSYQVRAEESPCGYQADMTDFIVAQRMAGFDQNKAIRLWEENGPKLSDPVQQMGMGIVVHATAAYVYQMPEDVLFSDGPNLGESVFAQCVKNGQN